MTELPRSSERIAEIAAALAAAQGAIEAPKKSKTAKIATKDKGSYEYAYADLADVIAAVRGPLAANGLGFTQDVRTGDQVVEVETVLTHSSGQWLRFGPIVLGAGGTAQALGAAVSYARRYGLAAALGVAAEVDDDAASVQGPTGEARGRRAQRKAEPAPEADPELEKATDGQMRAIHAKGASRGLDHEALRDWAGANLGIESLSELTVAGARAIMEYLEPLPPAPNGKTPKAEPDAEPDAEPTGAEVSGA